MCIVLATFYTATGKKVQFIGTLQYVATILQKKSYGWTYIGD